jgi:hypothetical protein
MGRFRTNTHHEHEDEGEDARGKEFDHQQVRGILPPEHQSKQCGHARGPEKAIGQDSAHRDYPNRIDGAVEQDLRLRLPVGTGPALD